MYVKTNTGTEFVLNQYLQVTTERRQSCHYSQKKGNSGHSRELGLGSIPQLFRAPNTLTLYTFHKFWDTATDITG